MFDVDPCSYSFHDCVVYPKVMAGHIAKMIREGDALGRPIIEPDDKVPNSPPAYVLTRVHPALTFLRANPANRAFEALKNLNLSPKQVKAQDMPNGIAFNNFVQVVYIRHMYDCPTSVSHCPVLCAFR